MNYLKRLEMRCLAILCVIFISGCTVTIEPLPKKQPVKKYAVKKRKHIPPKQTPTPPPKPLKQPMHLEPTDHPTPIIKVDKVTQLNLSTQPLL